jgi:phosphatidyl-myo-inositol dimannoside synthase
MAESPALLLITRNLPPLRGGMERLNLHMATALAAKYRITIVAPRGSRIDDAQQVRMRCCPFSGTLSFLVWAFFYAPCLAMARRPRWVIGGSGLVAPIVLVAGLLSGARRAVYLHGLDIVVKHRLYQVIWLPALRKLHRFVVNSRNTRQLAIDAGIDSSQIIIVPPGTEVPECPGSGLGSEVERFRAERDIGDGPVLLSVGRLTRRKGLAEFIEHSFPLILAERPNAKLLVIGDEAPNALNASGRGQRARIEAVAQRCGVQRSVHLLGAVSERDLRTAFAAASVHVFPVVDVPGDVEGFGMVAIEAAAYGVPTVAFDVGGVGDAVDDPSSGDLVSPGDYVRFADQVVRRVGGATVGTRRSCHAFAASFAWPIFEERIRGALDEGACRE